MKVISNTSPIINLAAIGQLDLLNKLFGNIYIPDEVYNEVCVIGQGQPGSTEVEQFTWIHVEPITKSVNLVKALKLDVDAGEAEAIALSVEKDADLLLIDELRGRNLAEYYGLNYIGILGVLLMAKKKNFINEVKPLLDKLTRDVGFRVSIELYDAVLKACDEGQA